MFRSNLATKPVIFRISEKPLRRSEMFHWHIRAALLETLAEMQFRPDPEKGHMPTVLETE